MDTYRYEHILRHQHHSNTTPSPAKSAEAVGLRYAPMRDRAFVASAMGAGSVTAHGGFSRSVSEWTDGMSAQGRWRRKSFALVSGDCVTMICPPLVCAAGIIIVQLPAEVRLVVE